MIIVFKLKLGLIFVFYFRLDYMFEFADENHYKTYSVNNIHFNENLMEWIKSKKSPLDNSAKIWGMQKIMLFDGRMELNHQFKDC